MVNTKRITDIITEEVVESWKPGENVLITAPMGSGKSFMCKNTLYNIAAKSGSRILMVIHRTNCVDQFNMELEAAGKSDVITVITYQSLEYAKLNGFSKYDLEQYQFIVSDEFHYFFADSTFNAYTEISFDLIMAAKNAVRIFMSATGENMSLYMRQYLEEHGYPAPLEYRLEPDYSFIRQLSFFYKDETVAEIMKRVPSGEKGICFIESAQEAHGLHRKFADRSTFVCSTSNKRYYKYVDAAEVQEILSAEKFSKQFLITTSCFDSGINIVDTSVKHIIIDIRDIGSLIQCIGRRRIQGPEDKINVYIKAQTNQRLNGFRKAAQTRITMADYFIKSGCDPVKLVQKFPRQNDSYNIIYDDLAYSQNGNVIPQVCSKKVNNLVYWKQRQNIDEYTKMLDIGNFGYCKYIAQKLGFYDKKKRRYTYKMEAEDVKLANYLEEMVKNETILYQPKDRDELISMIGARRDGRLLKTVKTLNSVLQEAGIEYRIKEFDTKRDVIGKDGVVKAKRYKSAWKIVRWS